MLLELLYRCTHPSRPSCGADGHPSVAARGSVGNPPPAGASRRVGLCPENTDGPVRVPLRDIKPPVRGARPVKTGEGVRVR
jgi:hypothetical protein